MMKPILQTMAFATTVTLTAGCASAGYKQAGITSSSLQDAAQSIDDTFVPLNAVLVALVDLVK